MNQQTEYSIKSSMTTCMNDNPTSMLKESILDKKLQNMPNVVEITAIMLGTILEENTKKMTQGEVQGFCNIVNALSNIICKLK